MHARAHQAEQRQKQSKGFGFFSRAVCLCGDFNCNNGCRFMGKSVHTYATQSLVLSCGARWIVHYAAASVRVCTRLACAHAYMSTTATRADVRRRTRARKYATRGSPWMQNLGRLVPSLISSPARLSTAHKPLARTGQTFTYKRCSNIFYTAARAASIAEKEAELRAHNTKYRLRLATKH